VKQIAIGDKCTVSSSKRIYYSDYVASGIPFWRSKEVIVQANGGEVNDPLYISEERYRGLSRFGYPAHGDVLLTSVGTIGVPYLVKEKDKFYFKDGNLTWLKDFSDDIDSEYIYYALQSPLVQGRINGVLIGSSQKALTIDALKQIRIPFPKLAKQRKVANALRNYDVLIERNRKQIDLLEEAAERLYKEWFIDLRFPGYENLKIVDALPDGWNQDRIDQLFEIAIGKTPPRSEARHFSKNGIPWVSVSDMGNEGTFIFNTNECLTKDAIEECNVRLVPEGSILLSFKLTVGRVAITTDEITTNEAIAHFKFSNNVMREYALLYLRAFPYESLGNTSSISKAINSTIVRRIPFIMPDEKVLNSFHELLYPIFKRNEVLRKQNMGLLESRDRLLVHLFSNDNEVV